MYHYRDRAAPVFDPSSFKEAIADRDSSYVRKGRYAEQLERYLEYFPSSQILILDFNEFAQNQQKSLDRVTDFLNIKRLKFEYEKRNVRSSRERAEDIHDAFVALNDYYAPHNRRLKAVLSELGVRMSWLE